MNKAVLRIIGLAATALGFGATLVSDWVDKKQMKEEIDETVDEALDRRLGGQKKGA